MPEFLLQPMPWYIAGPLIGLMVPLLLVLDNRQFGISSAYRHVRRGITQRQILFFQL